jgi:septum formation protein
MRSIVLASASAGRGELLRRTGLPFTIEPSNCDETTDASSPAEHVRMLALRKARAVAERHPDALVIGADTVIELDGEILGKPEAPSDAEKMLSRLAGQFHRLVTGIAIVDGAEGRSYCGVETTLVHIRHLTGEQIHSYVASGEPIGKSGSYDIQGLGATIIDRIEGDFSNVVGLPMAHLARALDSFGVRLP